MYLHQPFCWLYLKATVMQSYTKRSNSFRQELCRKPQQLALSQFHLQFMTCAGNNNGTWLNLNSFSSHRRHVRTLAWYDSTPSTRFPSPVDQTAACDQQGNKRHGKVKLISAPELLQRHVTVLPLQAFLQSGTFLNFPQLTFNCQFTP